MTCTTPPQTLADFLRVIDTCAALYAGTPSWQPLALLGALVIAIATAVVAALFVVLGRYQ